MGKQGIKKFKTVAIATALCTLISGCGSSTATTAEESTEDEIAVAEENSSSDTQIAASRDWSITPVE